MAQQKNSGSASLRNAVESSGKQSGRRAVASLILAFGAAIGCVFLVIRYLDTHSIGGAKPTVPVVVASVDLPLGTALTKEDIQVVPWPQEAAPDGAFATEADLIDRVIVAKIFKGEPITKNRVAVAGAGTGLAAVLPEGYLAVSVRVDDVVGVAGFVHPGDSVDVIVTMQPNTGEPVVSKFILYNIKVLAVGKQIERIEGSKASRPVSATVATLMVKPEEAERLALSAAKGQLLLALRSSLDQEVIETKGIIPSVLLSGVQRQAPRKPKPAEPIVKPDTVEIMRGDSFEQRTFRDR
ncbi:MAG: Flp pilus assembly protein CpaB [Deltaproteobacteria bacterium RIFOXYA12_FULL_58_15]|nr:MAG: Flp pilus assembly protein CpaB [Deltaproteobacteria bacterium RIFOXYA12_FULL_58_15]OGR10066.1 MAG: Flp pilus assembly protein CpaB [Deltaproteobacteria bacterium RIFOXYB12_FULL_58_9]